MTATTTSLATHLRRARNVLLIAGAMQLTAAAEASAQKQTQPREEPVQMTIQCDFTPLVGAVQCQNGGDSLYVYSVPSGKRLVIESMEVMALSSLAQGVVSQIGTWSIGQDRITWHSMHAPPAPWGNNLYVNLAYREGRWHADPGTNVHFNVWRSPAFGSLQVFLRVSGYLLTL
jgi:hypothetical protein